MIIERDEGGRDFSGNRRKVDSRSVDRVLLLIRRGYILPLSQQLGKVLKWVTG